MGNCGQFVHLITASLLLAAHVEAIPLEQFYPFGSEAGDTLVQRTLDGSSPVHMLPSPFSYFGQNFTTVYVNNNGHISFSTPRSDFNPVEFPIGGGFDMVATFWADADTRPLDGGYVWYRNTTDPELLLRATGDIKKIYPHYSDSEYLFIVTWDHIGYFDEQTDKSNTFQCILMTNGTESYSIFLYADGLIQWTSSVDQGGQDGTGGNAALVGYNAGDGVISFTVPGSQTDEIIKIASTSNVGVPGMWVFRLDQDDVVLPRCQENSNALLFLTPRFGSQLGGTAVEVRGPCFNADDIVRCSFGGVSTTGLFVDQDEVLCVTPTLNAIGRVAVSVEIQSTEGNVTFVGNTVFLSLPIDRAHGVDIQPSILLDHNTDIRVQWDPANVLPMLGNSNLFTVNVIIYQYLGRDGDGRWMEHKRLNGLPNDGKASMTLANFQSLSKGAAFPTCIEVAVGTPNSSIPSNKRALLERINQASYQPGIWSGLVFSTLATIHPNETRNQEFLRTKFSRQCNLWHGDPQQNLSQGYTNSLLPCPPTLDQAQLPNSGLKEEHKTSVLYNTDYHSQWMRYFHGNVAKCYVQSGVGSGSGGQQCCYDADGRLVVGGPGGGSVNRIAPVDTISFYEHIRHDVIPYIYCCFTSCIKYYEKRPSDNGNRYQPRLPACVYGDPHVITLDGLRYTFNGKGEFTLIETESNIFTLQGRMVEAVSLSGESSLATVFSAIVGKQKDSDSVQFTLSSESGIDVAVNGEQITFDGMVEQSFSNVVITDKGNNSFSAIFSSGAYIEVRASNGILSLLLVSLPITFLNTTRGLMGSYNGNTSDDLVPKIGNGLGKPISVNSSLEDIHTQFGITWIIGKPEDSLFTYATGESWASFYDPNFSPVFSTVFDDPNLEQQAQEICGNDEFCRFDIAATKRPEIGMTTVMNTQEFDMIANMSVPNVCIPACDNGVCISTNTCHCAEGYTGETCSEAVLSECDDNPCENGGSCQTLAGSLICYCPPGLTGVLCESLLPPEEVNDTISSTPLMAVPLNVNPVQLGFDDYRDLISVCYEIQGSVRDIVNLVSTQCTSIAARYAAPYGGSSQKLFDAIGIRSVDSAGMCHNIRVDHKCSVIFDNQQISSNMTSNNISIKINPMSVVVTVPNCGKEVGVLVRCENTLISFSGNRLPTNVMNITIIRGYDKQEESHGLIGQFWSAPVSAEPYTGNTVGLTPGYPPYTVTVGDPSTSESRKFVGVLIPRLWNREAGQCLYAGNSRGGPTGGSPPVSMGSVIQGEYADYRVGSLFNTVFTYSKFNQQLC